jgi:vitamin B12 transporter
MFPSCHGRALGAGLLLSACAAAAQPVPTAAPASEGPIVVTASRVAQPLADVLADLRVIDRETIERSGVASLPELLRRHAGAEIATTGGPGQVSAVFLRGANANHVVLLVDGVRVNSATTGTNAFEHLPPDMIERIEVLRAPASALYGADAIGGVIQVFTRRAASDADGVSARARATLGSDVTRQGSASLAGRTGATDWSLRAGAQATRGFSATDASASPFVYNPDDDGYRNADVAGGVGHEWAPGHRLSLSGTWTSSRTDFDGGPDSDDVNRQRLSTFALDSRDVLSDGWTSVLRLARGTDDLEIDGAFPGRFRTDQDQASWQNELDGEGWRGVAGVEWRRERVEASTAYTVDERRVGSVFASGSLDVDAPGTVALQASVRHDDDSQFGGRTTGSVAAGWRFAPGWRATAAASTAFKAPSFNDLYFPLSFGFSGNPDLRPETSRGGEIALRRESGPWRAGLVAWRNRVRDLIAVDPSFSTVVNVDRAILEGATVDAGWARGPWSIAAEATFQDPRNEDTGNVLVRRAKRFASASLGYAPGPWEAGIEWQASGPRFDSASNTQASRMAGYGLVHLRARWALDAAWSLDARIDNALDKDYTLVQGYQAAGRQFFVGLAWQGR